MGIEIPPERWGAFVPRLGIGTRRVLDALRGADARGTFFILGAAAERHPELVREIAADGHEIASHGWSHTKVYDLTPRSFTQEVVRTDDLLEELTGQRPKGFRAPYFSITRDSLWALDILREQGYLYDASIYPGSNYRYGIPGSSHLVHRLPNGLVEFPVSTFELAGRRVGVGGAYLRILPLSLTRRGLRKRDAQRLDTTVYLHPWELDPSHPVVRFPWKAMATHYARLRTTGRKFRALLDGSRPVTMREQLAGWLDESQ